MKMLKVWWWGDYYEERTRYFGGIKLGAGGLVRAYTKSTSEIIKEYENEI